MRGKWCKNVATNIGKTFLKIVDEEFPLGHTLHKIFNGNTIKISYSCMTNAKQIIDGRNKNKLSTNNVTTEKGLCKCRRTDECPMQNKCLTDWIVYQATVTTKPPSKQDTIIINLPLPTQPNEMRLSSVNSQRT